MSMKADATGSALGAAIVFGLAKLGRFPNKTAALIASLGIPAGWATARVLWKPSTPVDDTSASIYVSPVTGPKIQLDVNLEETTMGDIKHLIWQREGTEPSRQKLIVGGALYDDSVKLGDIGVRKDSTLYLGVKLPG